MKNPACYSWLHLIITPQDVFGTRQPQIFFPSTSLRKSPKDTMAKINTSTRSIISTPNQYCNTVAIMSPRVQPSQPAVAGSKNKLLHPYQK